MKTPSVGGKQMETSTERWEWGERERERERERESERDQKRQNKASDLSLGANFCLSATELAFIRTTRVPGDAFHGPVRTDTDLMRQRGEETETQTTITHNNH